MSLERWGWIATQILQAVVTIFMALTAVRIVNSVATSEPSVVRQLLVVALALDFIVSVALFQWLTFLRYRSWEAGVEHETGSIRTFRKRITLGWLTGGALLFLLAVIGD